MLVPAYHPLLRRSRPTQKTITVWPSGMDSSAQTGSFFFTAEEYGTITCRLTTQKSFQIVFQKWSQTFESGNEFYGPVYIGIGADSKDEEVTRKTPALSFTACPYGSSLNASSAEDQKNWINVMSTLRELYERKSGVKLLSARVEDPHCSLSTLQVEHGGEIRIKPGLKKYSFGLSFTL
ncbi:hypothetical protein MHYP_G00090680 [Metynnis hypsauchen]